jgi:hypothetical protein
MNKTTAGLIALAAVAGLALLTTGVVVVASRQAPKAASAARSPASDPYPECAAVRDWLNRNLNDPTGLEILEWKRLTDADKIPQWPARLVRVDVKLRARNQYGGRQVETKSLFFRDGKLRGEVP